MGRGVRAGKVTKQPHTITRSDWNTAARTIKRKELDIVASICGTTRDTTGEVQRRTSNYNEHDDGATAAAANERASESTSDSGISTATV